MRALQIAATGMAAQQTRVEVISQNLANMSTTGYNARRAEFADLADHVLTAMHGVGAEIASRVLAEAGFTDIEHFYHAMNWHGWVAYA